VSGLGRFGLAAITRLAQVRSGQAWVGFEHEPKGECSKEHGDQGTEAQGTIHVGQCRTIALVAQGGGKRCQPKIEMSPWRSAVARGRG
jgi:hypothetical protein